MWTTNKDNDDDLIIISDEDNVDNSIDGDGDNNNTDMEAKDNNGLGFDGEMLDTSEDSKTESENITNTEETNSSEPPDINFSGLWNSSSEDKSDSSFEGSDYSDNFSKDSFKDTNHDSWDVNSIIDEAIYKLNSMEEINSSSKNKYLDEIADLKSKIKALDGDVSDYQKTVEDLDSENKKIKINIKKLESMKEMGEIEKVDESFDVKETSKIISTPKKKKS